MRVKNLMDEELGTIHYRGKKQEIANKMLETDNSSVLVVDEDDKLMGIVSGYDLRKEIAIEDKKRQEQDKTAGDIMTPLSSLVTIAPDSYINKAVDLFSQKKVNQIPVVNGTYPVGLLRMAPTLDYYKRKERVARLRIEELEEFVDLVDNLHEALIVLDKDFKLRVVNKAAQRLLDISAHSHNEKGSLFNLFPEFREMVEEVLRKGEAKHFVEITELYGKSYVGNLIPLKNNKGQINGILKTLSDVTQMKKLQWELKKANKELDKAFALTLPNYKVENKLRTTPEYRDLFDPNTGNITISEKIEDGGYRHVINALKVAADLHEKGVMNLVGIDKDALVRTIIFHDIGKTQPHLEEGMVVNPYKIFEEGKNHAARSAEFAGKFYDQNENIVNLIYYHHHKEEELPGDFPSHLLPSLRLFKIIDGCSAGITRRDARISFEVIDTKIIINEQNFHPMFNLTKTIDLFSGNYWTQALKEDFKEEETV